MSADAAPNQKSASPVPKPLVLPFVTGLISAIALGGVMLYSQRDRYDTTVYWWCAILIAGMFAASIPVAFVQKKRRERTVRHPFLPWPKPVANPDFGSSLTPSALCLSGTFIWTPAAFTQIAKAWLRHTPAGRRQRRTRATLTLIALAGIVLAAIFLWQREWSAIVLMLASLLLLLFAYDCRIRPPREVLSSARAHWDLFADGFIISTQETRQVLDWRHVCAVLQTPAGFIFWPQNLFEICLPASAFANSGELNSFAAVARARVRDFVRID